MGNCASSTIDARANRALNESAEQTSSGSRTTKVVLTIKTPASAQDPAYRGISVYGFRHVFLKDVKQVHGLNEHSTIYQIEDLRNADRPGFIRRKGMDVICPMSGEKGAAYVHCLQGEDYVGNATHMLSYTWGYTVGHILDTLEGYCESNNLDPKRTYIWICCLCNNQHKIIRDRQKGIDVPFDEFHSVFQGRVRGIGRVIAMMAPWDNPSYLKRVWCLFEIFTAMQSKECDLTIQMPSIERQNMWDAVMNRRIDDGNNFGAFYRALTNTSVVKGEASVDLDRDRILAILGMLVGGHKAVDVEINQYLRGWVENTIMLLYQEAKSRCESNDLGAAEYATTCNNVASFLDSIGQHERSLLIHREAFAIREATLGKDHPDTASSYNNIGATLHNMGRYEEALVEYEKAVAIREATLGKNHHDTAASYINIGMALDSMGRYEEALVEHHKALATLEATLGKDHPSTATSYNNIGGTLDSMGQYDEALVEYGKALAIREATLGKDHPSTASSHNNIGLTLKGMGRYEEALVEYQKALAILEATLGKDHPSTAGTYNNIGLTLEGMGRYAEALVECRKALAIKEVTLGKDNPSTATSYNNIASTLNGMGRYEEALVEHHKALAILEATLGKDHPSTASSHNNIGLTLEGMGRHEEALVEYRKALVIREATLGKDHPSTATSYNNIGVTLFHLRKYEEALVELLKSYVIWSTVLGKEHPQTKSSHSSVVAVVQTMAHDDANRNEMELEKSRDQEHDVKRKGALTSSRSNRR